MRNLIEVCESFADFSLMSVFGFLAWIIKFVRMDQQLGQSWISSLYDKSSAVKTWNGSQRCPHIQGKLTSLKSESSCV